MDELATTKAARDSKTEWMKQQGKVFHQHLLLHLNLPCQNRQALAHIQFLLSLPFCRRLTGARAGAGKVLNQRGKEEACREGEMRIKRWIPESFWQPGTTASRIGFWQPEPNVWIEARKKLKWKYSVKFRAIEHANVFIQNESNPFRAPCFRGCSC